MRKLELLHKDSVLDVPSLASARELSEGERVPQNNNEPGEDAKDVGMNIEDAATDRSPGHGASDKNSSQISSQWRSLFGVQASAISDSSVIQNDVEPDPPQDGDMPSNELLGNSVDCEARFPASEANNADAPSVLSEDDFSRDSWGSVKVMKYDMPSDSYGATKQKSLLYEEAERRTKKNPLQNFVDNLPWNKDREEREKDKIPTIAEDLPTQDEGNLWQDLLVPELAEERRAKKPTRRRDFKRPVRNHVPSDNSSVGYWNSNSSGMSWVSQSMKGRGILKGVPSQIGISQVGVFGDDSSLYSQSSFGSQTSSASRRSLFPRVQYQVTSNKVKQKKVSFASKARVVVFQHRIDSPDDLGEWDNAEIWWQKEDYREFRKVGELILTAVCEGDSDVWSSHYKELQNEEDKKKWWHLLGHSSRGLEHVADVEEGDRRVQIVKDSMKVVFDEQRRQRKHNNSQRFNASNSTSSVPAQDPDIMREKYDMGAFRERYFAATERARELAHTRALDDQVQASTGEALYTWEYRRYVEYRKQRNSLRQQQRKIYEASALILCRSVRRFLGKIRRSREIRNQQAAATKIQSLYRRVLSNRVLKERFGPSNDVDLRHSPEGPAFQDPVLQNLSQNLISRRISSDALNLLPLEEVDSEDESSTNSCAKDDLEHSTVQIQDEIEGPHNTLSHTTGIEVVTNDPSLKSDCLKDGHDATFEWEIIEDGASKQILDKDTPAVDNGARSQESLETNVSESESVLPSLLAEGMTLRDTQTLKDSMDSPSATADGDVESDASTPIETGKGVRDFDRSESMDLGDIHADKVHGEYTASSSTLAAPEDDLTDDSTEPEKSSEIDQWKLDIVEETNTMTIVAPIPGDATEVSRESECSKSVDSSELQHENEMLFKNEKTPHVKEVALQSKSPSVTSPLKTDCSSEMKEIRTVSPGIPVEEEVLHSAVKSDDEASAKEDSSLSCDNSNKPKQSTEIPQVASLISEVVIREEDSMVCERAMLEISDLDDSKVETPRKNKSSLSRWFTFPFVTAGVVCIGAYYLKPDLLAGGHLSFLMPGLTRVFPTCDARVKVDCESVLHESVAVPVSIREGHCQSSVIDLDDLESIESFSSSLDQLIADDNEKHDSSPEMKKGDVSKRGQLVDNDAYQSVSGAEKEERRSKSATSIFHSDKIEKNLSGIEMGADQDVAVGELSRDRIRPSQASTRANESERREKSGRPIVAKDTNDPGKDTLD